MTRNNALWNCKNPYQGEYKKVLCICSAGLLRSPTMAKVLSETYGYNTRAAGITEEYALIDVTDVLIEWADEIVVAEKEIGYTLMSKFPEVKEYICLDIPDHFSYCDPKLIQIISERYQESIHGN